MAFAPGELSSLSFNLNEGVPVSIYSDILATTAYSEFVYTKPIRPDELACPTWGLNDSSPYATIGPPYYPLVVLPEAILSLHSAWEKCQSNSVLYATPGIFDPPKILTTAISADTIITSNLNLQTTTRARPAYRMTADLPIATPVSVTSDSVSSLTAIAKDLNGNDSPPKGTEVRVPAKIPVTDPQAFSALINDGLHQSTSLSSDKISRTDGQVVNDPSQTTLSDISVAGYSNNVNGPAAKSLGAVIYSVLQNYGSGLEESISSATAADLKSSSKSPGVISTYPIVSAHSSSEHTISSDTFIPGGNLISKSITQTGLGPLSKLTNDNNPSPPPPPLITTLPNQLPSVNPTAFIINDETLSPGGPALTISGHPVSFDPSDNLIRGTKTIDIPHAFVAPLPSTYTPNGKSRTENHSPLSIHRAKSVVGEVTMTVSEAVINLDAGRTLHVETGEVPLATMAGGSEDAENAQIRLVVPGVMSLAAATGLVVLVVSLVWC